MQSIGSAIGSALQQYGENKAQQEFLTQRYESLKPYIESMAQSGNVMDERSPESKILADITKFGNMSLPQKKAALLNAEFFLDRLDKAKAREMQDIQAKAAEQQLALGALQLGQAQREAAAAPYFTQAIADVMSMQPGQAPSVPYSNVTQEMLSKYGDKLTPTQMQSLIPMLRRAGQAIPAGLVPTGAKITPAGVETEYGAEPIIGSTEIPGTDYVQPTKGGVPFGTAIKSQYKGTNLYLGLEKPQQDAAKDLVSEFNAQQVIKSLSTAESFFNAMTELGVGTKKYTTSDDIALVYSFMKTLDPTSTVGPTEYATASKAGGVPEAIRNTYNRLRDGEFLTDEQRLDFIDTARKNYLGIAKAAETVASRYRTMAKDRGIPENLVVPSNMFEQVKRFEAKNLQRFQSEQDMRAAGVKRALVFDPAMNKYREFEIKD